MNEEQKRFVGVRVETIQNKDNYLQRLKHNTRYTKVKEVKNNFGIEVFRQGGWENIQGFNSEYAKEAINAAKRYYDSIVEEHRQKYKHFHSKKSRTFAEGVLYFSKGINKDYEENEEEFKSRVNEFMNKFEEEFKTKVLTYQIHKDEVGLIESGEKVGNIHVHFTFKNFNNEDGKSINITKNKEQGSRVQDLCFECFKDFGKGYERGIKKTAYRKYLTPNEYKKYQDTLKKAKKLEEENNSLEEKNKLLEEENNSLSQTLDKYKKYIKEYEKYILILKRDVQQFEKIEDYHVNQIEQIIKDLLELKNEKEVEGFIKKLMRSAKSENKTRLQKLLDKYSKSLESTKTRITKRRKAANSFDKKFKSSIGQLE